MSSPTPIFIFSLPRAGSTLLQRLLAAHPDITSASEPTFLLPLLHADRDAEIYSAYNHELAAVAVRDFIRALPGGEADYLAEIAGLARRLYARASAGERYFVDKTPRYSLVVDRIFKAFPDGKFIFLWRNPLASVASLMRTFNRNRWNFYLFAVHFNVGLPNLVDAARLQRGRSAVLRYEDLIAAPDAELRRLFAYLELPYQEDILETFSDVRFEGRLGDPNAGKPGYQQLRSRSADWPSAFCNPLRTIWAHRFIEKVGTTTLKQMGYPAGELKRQLQDQPDAFRMILSDLYRMPYSALYPWFEIRMLKDKLGAWRSGHGPLIHR